MTLPTSWFHAIDKSPCPTFIIDRRDDIVLTYANQKGLTVLGMPDIHAPVPLSNHIELDTSRINEPEVEQMTAYLKLPSTVERISISLRVLEDNQFVLYIIDRTEHHHQQRLQSFIEQNQEAVIDVDANGKVRLANPEGWRQVEEDDTLVATSLKSYEAHSSLAPHKSFIFDHPFYTKEGQLLHYRVKFVPIFVDNLFDGGFIIAVDQSLQVEARIELAEKSMQYEQLWNSAHMPMVRVDEQARIARVNQAFEDIFGYTNEELVGKRNPTLPKDTEIVRFSDQLSKGKTVEAHETYRITKQGKRIDVLAYYTPILNYRGQVLGAHILYNNISESKAYQRELSKSQEKYRVLSESAFDIISILDANGRVQFISPSVYEVAGYKEEDLLHSSIFIFIHPDDQEEVYQLLSEDWKKIKRKKIEVRLLNAKNQYTWNEASITTLVHEEEDVKFIFAIRDISKLKKMQEELSSMAFYDYLTGLPNRRLFDERLYKELMHNKRRGHGLAVLMIDGHRFKAINDTYGHDIGDQVIRVMAKRLEACDRDSDTVARFGGDEMSIILTDIVDPTHVDTVIQRIHESFRRPMEVEGNLLEVHLGIGIALSPQDTMDAHELVRRADQALYRSKGSGPSPKETTWSYYHDKTRENRV